MRTGFVASTGIFHLSYIFGSFLFVTTFRECLQSGIFFNGSPFKRKNLFDELNVGTTSEKEKKNLEPISSHKSLKQSRPTEIYVV